MAPSSTTTTTTTTASLTTFYESPQATSLLKTTGEKFLAPYATALIDRSILRSTSRPTTAKNKNNEKNNNNNDDDDDKHSPLVILDNACGTGLVSAIIHRTLPQHLKESMRLICCDLSGPFISSVQQRISQENWTNTRAEIVDMQDMKTFQTDTFTHVLTNFAINLVPDPSAALRECFRVLRGKGTCAFAVPSTIGWFEHVKGAFESAATVMGEEEDWPCPSMAEFLAKANGGQWDSMEFVGGMLMEQGFLDVRVESLNSRMSLGSPREFCDVLKPMWELIVNGYWSQEQRERSGDGVGEVVKRYLVEKYGEEGEVGMDWVGIVASGKKPGA